jgi:hypothetical protein
LSSGADIYLWPSEGPNVMQMATCPGCGFLVQRDWETCKFCKQPLTQGAAAAPGASAPGGPVAFGPPAAGPQSPLAPPPGLFAPIPPAPTQPTPRTGLPLTKVVLGVLAVAAVVAGLFVFLNRDAGGQKFPKDWDPRVADLANYVEDHRGLMYVHPVEVDFLTTDEYSTQTRTDESSLSDEDKQDLADATKEFQALGLIDGDTNLLDATNALQDTGTLAFYSFETKKITVRGTQLTIPLKVTLVHELTHALQDQHWDLAALRDAKPSGAASAATAIIEGDARRIENEYVDGLSDTDKKIYDAAQPDSADDAGLGDVPDSMLAAFEAPYTFGPQFLDAVIASKSLQSGSANSAVDSIFSDPPTNEEVVIDPVRYLDHDKATPLPDLTPPSGARLVETSDFGVQALFLVLAERIDPRQALAAVDGWNGDAMVAYEKDDKVCVDVEVATDTPADADDLAAAFTAWTQAMPAGATSTDRKGGNVTLHACDPGGSARAKTTGQGAAATAYPVSRSALEVEFLKQGAPPDKASCVATNTIMGLTIEQLAGTDEAPILAAVQTAAATCLGG